MPTLQELNEQQVHQAITAAVERHIPVILTIPAAASWTAVYGRAMAIRNDRLWVELMPTASAPATPTLSAGDKVGVSFKLKHHKHIFTTTVTGKELFKLEDDREVSMLSLCQPLKMQRLQRRAYFRAEVPGNRIVRASFWLGGKALEPSGGAPSTPVWSGRVINLSAGGFQIQTDRVAAEALEPGDVVGIRLVFGMGEQTVYADGELRHVETVTDNAYLGFKFIGLEQTQEGTTILQVIARKISEFQKAAEGTVSRKA